MDRCPVMAPVANDISSGILIFLLGMRIEAPGRTGKELPNSSKHAGKRGLEGLRPFSKNLKLPNPAFIVCANQCAETLHLRMVRGRSCGIELVTRRIQHWRSLQQCTADVTHLPPRPTTRRDWYYLHRKFAPLILHHRTTARIVKCTFIEARFYSLRVEVCGLVAR
jgi:hypothetical protein